MTILNTLDYLFLLPSTTAVHMELYNYSKKNIVQTSGGKENTETGLLETLIKHPCFNIAAFPRQAEWFLEW